MVGLIEVFYFSGGIIYWILGILTFIQYLKNRFKNELFLSLYFFNIGFLFPLILFAPYISENDNFIRFLLIGANITIPIVMIFLNLFLDYTLYERQTFWSLFSLFIGGGIVFISILIADQIDFDPVTTVFGEFIIINVTSSSNLVGVVFYLVYSITIIVVLRFIIVGIKLAKRNVNNENYLNVRKIILILFFGQLIWIIISLLKRVYPEYLIGADFFLMSCFFTFLVFYHVKHHEMFYFLPSSLRRAILIYKSGIHICDYDFFTKEIIDNGVSLQGTDLTLVRCGLFGATVAIEQIVQQEIGYNDNLGTINFENYKVVLYKTKNIYWWLVCEKYSQYYSVVINKIANRIETNYKDEIQLFQKGRRPSKSFKHGVKSEFDRIS